MAAILNENDLLSSANDMLLPPSKLTIIEESKGRMYSEFSETSADNCDSPKSDVMPVSPMTVLKQQIEAKEQDSLGILDASWPGLSPIASNTPSPKFNFTDRNSYGQSCRRIKVKGKKDRRFCPSYQRRRGKLSTEFYFRQEKDDVPFPQVKIEMYNFDSIPEE